ncbi:MAG TPA: hypothetical protein VMU51_11555 [Mycobacteriales bacterium]|nr:hypothetical protein [Mycobacteriales bacterium]
MRSPSRGEIVVLDSATETRPGLRGCVLVTGSHGGRYPAELVAAAGVRAAVFNDAGGGLAGAGVAGLGYLAGLGIPAAAVGHTTARVGFGADGLTGTITEVNPPATALGCTPGMSGAEVAGLLAAAPLREPVPASAEPARFDLAARVRGFDSASLVSAADVTYFAVTGSHGGLRRGDPGSALRARALGALFNDACGGRDHAGTSRLPALDEVGVPAGTVSGHTARIGDARSTYQDGIISAANATASACGGAIGMTANEFIQALLAGLPAAHPEASG